MDVGGEIRLGSALFTMVEPHPGHEVEYNRWYERDHFYAGCMVGPWLFAGRRWVCTRPLKDLRFGDEPDVFGDVRRGSYLALYWVIEGKHDEHFTWGLRQVKWLHENGRMFEHRDHVHTLLYKFLWSEGREDGVPAELALDHPFGGLVTSVIELAAGATADEFRDFLRRDVAPELELALRPIPLPPGAPVDQPGLQDLDRRLLTLGFVRDDPAAIWEEQREAAARLGASGVGRMLWTSPWIPTIPGTDTYTDQLR